MLQIIQRSTEADDQNHSQPFFCTLQIVLRVHQARNAIALDLPTKKEGKPAHNSVAADHAVNTVFRELVRAGCYVVLFWLTGT